MMPKVTITGTELREIAKGEEIAALIPAPVKASPDGTAIPYWDWTYPRSEAYEAAVAPLLPARWKLYSVVDGDKHPTMCGRDFGATRDDEKGYVLGIRDIDGTPKHLSARVRSVQPGDGAEKTFPPHALAEACRWCDERIAAREKVGGFILDESQIPKNFDVEARAGNGLIRPK